MNRIAIGFGSILGTIGALAGLMVPFIGQLADSSDPLGVPPQTWVVTGAVLASLVVVGRMGQAIAQQFAVSPVDDFDEESFIDPDPTEPTDVQGL